MVDIIKTYFDICDSAYENWKAYTGTYLKYWDNN